MRNFTDEDIYLLYQLDKGMTGCEDGATAYTAGFRQALASQAALTAVPAQEPVRQEGWVSIEERLPELGEDIVIADIEAPDEMRFAVLIDSFGRKCWKLLPSETYMSLHQYTHWRLSPLPPVKGVAE